LAVGREFDSPELFSLSLSSKSKKKKKLKGRDEKEVGKYE
jgi:hypothetical protein